jgi:hypothetical protein
LSKVRYICFKSFVMNLTDQQREDFRCRTQSFALAFLVITCICNMDISYSDNQIVKYFLDLISLLHSEQFVAILVFIELPPPPQTHQSLSLGIRQVPIFLGSLNHVLYSQQKHCFSHLNGGPVCAWRRSLLWMVFCISELMRYTWKCSFCDT